MLAFSRLMKQVREQMLTSGYFLTQCPFTQFGQKLRKAALTPDIDQNILQHLLKGNRIWSVLSVLVSG